jgi:hypothetical protein
MHFEMMLFTKRGYQTWIVVSVRRMMFFDAKVTRRHGKSLPFAILLSRFATRSPNWQVISQATPPLKAR